MRKKNCREEKFWRNSTTGNNKCIDPESALPGNHAITDSADDDNTTQLELYVMLALRSTQLELGDVAHLNLVTLRAAGRPVCLGLSLVYKMQCVEYLTNKSFLEY